jgi:hypothetical protein
MKMETGVKRNIVIPRGFVLVVVIVLGFFLSSARYKDLPGSGITLQIEHVVGDLSLQLDSINYRNALGQSFSISKFKYYLGNFIFRGAGGKEFRVEDHFLINEEDSASKRLSFPMVPPGHYSTLEFSIGVDSLNNCSGAQSGALDPVNGMFWAWNTGYIFLKLEGVSPASKLPGHLFEYHIGGYRQPNCCIRKVVLPIPKTDPATFPQSIQVKADILKLLQGPARIDLEKLPSVTDFHHAVLVADNYAKMFSISTRNEKETD